jgi:hypothetical protein
VGVTEQEQVDELLAVQGYDNDVEEELHRARIVRITLFERTRASIARSYEIVFDTGRICIFKPGNCLLEPAADGLFHGKRALKNYGHTPLSTTISECAAWQLAKHLGAPWSDLVVTAVLKWHELPDTGNVEVGAASLYRGGEAGKQTFYQAVPDQVSAAAFFDALIGQQDRHKGNVLWYEPQATIYLGRFVTPDRIEALAARARRMRETRRMVWEL